MTLSQPCGYTMDESNDAVSSMGDIVKDRASQQLRDTQRTLIC